MAKEEMDWAGADRLAQLVYKHGTNTAAGKELGLSSSTIGKYLKDGKMPKVVDLACAALLQAEVMLVLQINGGGQIKAIAKIKKMADKADGGMLLETF